MICLATMKPLNIVFLSLFVMHAGVAWAIQNCLARTVHADHEESSHTHQTPAHSEIIVVPEAFQLSGDRASNLSSLHCLKSGHQIGPMAFPSTPRLEPSIDSAQAKVFRSQPGSASWGEAGDFSLRALFKWPLLSSTRTYTARHLLLSVLQI